MIPAGVERIDKILGNVSSILDKPYLRLYESKVSILAEVCNGNVQQKKHISRKVIYYGVVSVAAK